MDIRDKIKVFLNEGPIQDRLAAMKAGKNNTMATRTNIPTGADKHMQNQFIMKNKALIVKLLQALTFHSNRLTLSDMKKYMNNREDLVDQITNFGWLQKSKHPGEFYELSPAGVDAIGGIA